MSQGDPSHPINKDARGRVVVTFVLYAAFLSTLVIYAVLIQFILGGRPPVFSQLPVPLWMLMGCLAFMQITPVELIAQKNFQRGRENGVDFWASVKTRLILRAAAREAMGVLGLVGVVLGMPVMHGLIFILVSLILLLALLPGLIEDARTYLAA